jgi:putative salt-induced outer membrane protein
MRRRMIMAYGFVILLLVSLMVGDPTGRSHAAEELPPWKGNIEVSYVQSSGNTDSLSLVAAGKVERKTNRSRFAGEAKTIYGRKNDTTSAKSWSTALKYDFQLTDNLSLFVLESVERDTLKGIEFRSMHQGGLGYYFIKTSSDTLQGEAGAGYTQEDLVEPFNNRELPTARLFVGYIRSFTPKNRFEQRVEYLPNLKNSKDYIINEESALITNLMGNFAFKISYTISYDNLPTERFDKMDRIFKSSLLYTF